MIDAGRLMRARRGKQTTLDAAAAAGFALAQVASGAGDRVGLLVYGRGVVRLRAGPRRAHLRAAQSLAVARAETAEAAHAARGRDAAAAQKRRASSCADRRRGRRRCRRSSKARRTWCHRRVLVSRCRGRPTSSRVAAAVPESERDLYRGWRRIVERRAALLAHLRQRGAMVVEVESPELTGAVVNGYLTIKERICVADGAEGRRREQRQHRGADRELHRRRDVVGDTKPSMTPATSATEWRRAATATAAD